MTKFEQILTIVLIVGSLTALLFPAAYLGIGSRPATSVVELGQLNAALQEYSAIFGERPPSFFNELAPQQHLKKLFPKSIDSAPARLDAAECLVFWLQGFADSQRMPLTGGRRLALMQFDLTRLRDADGDGFPEYYPPDCQTPYAYFHHATYAQDRFVFSPTTGVAQPYLSDDPERTYINDDSFQILCAGLDDHFGHGGSFPSGKGYAQQDWDNLTNFSGGTLESKRVP